MSQKDGDQTTLTTRAWQPIVLREWATKSVWEARGGGAHSSCPSNLCQNRDLQHLDGQQVLLAIH